MGVEARANSIYSNGVVPQQTVAVLRVCRIADGEILYYAGGQPDLGPRQIQTAQAMGARPVVRAGAHAEATVINQAQADARLAGGYVPLDIYATNSICSVCASAIEDSGGVSFEDGRGGRFGRWIGVVW